MIVMDVKLNNFCAFKDFHINMSYPKKIVNSSIEDEFLQEYPNFRYKKVNILMGSNASGKTSFGKMLMGIFNFINRKELAYITDRIADEKKESFFSIDYIERLAIAKVNIGNPEDLNIWGLCLCRLEVNIPAVENKNYTLDKCRISVKTIPVKDGDNYEKCAKRLNSIAEIKGLEGLEKLSQAPRFGWKFTYPMDSNSAFSNIKIGDLENNLYLRVLKNILITLDNSISDVTKVKDIENTYAIKIGNKGLIIQDGELLDPNNILSSGTKAGIDVADLLASIIEHKNGFYYCDEKFSYIHSDIEKALLSLMISNLGDREQLFFTTHNLDIADMDLPKHSFYFMKKENIDGDISISCEAASSELKSTDSVRNAIDNDVFMVSPRVERLYELGNNEVI